MNNWCICWFFTHILTGDFIFKGLTARRLYKSFGVKGLSSDVTQLFHNLVLKFCLLQALVFFAHPRSGRFTWLRDQREA
jgi:hypothetical protein